MTIKITPAKLALAQGGETVALEGGYFLQATACGNSWKYGLSWENQSGLTRYARPGLEAAQWAVNASEEEYAAES
jgi:hypothetical protein